MVKKCLGMHFGVLHFHKSGSQSMKEMFLCLTEEIECKPATDLPKGKGLMSFISLSAREVPCHRAAVDYISLCHVVLPSCHQCNGSVIKTSRRYF